MKKTIVPIAVGFLLTACTTLPTKQKALNQHLDWQIRQAQLTHIKQWQLQGAVAVKTPQQSQAATFIWRQQWQRNRYQIHLFGPLGIGHVILISNPNDIVISEKGKRYQNRDAETLMQKILGWNVPVSNLYFWIRGLPAPYVKSKITFDAYHHIVHLQQQGWHIIYQCYTAATGSIDLPSIIILQREDLNIKFVISRWKLK